MVTPVDATQELSGRAPSTRHGFLSYRAEQVKLLVDRREPLPR